MLKFCPNCGFHLAGGEEFCPNCGFKLSGITDVSEKNAPVEAPAEKLKPIPPTPEKSISTAIAPKKKTKKKWPVLLGGLLVILAGCVATFFLFFHDEKLTGNYSSTINFLGTETTETFKFSGDKVTQLSEGKKVNSGKYSISKGILSIKIGTATLSANLKKDKEAFTIESGSGLSSILKGVTYIKNGTSTKKKASAPKKVTATAAETNASNNHVRGTYKIAKHHLVIATGKNNFSAKIDEQKKTLSLAAPEVPKFVATILDTKSAADTDTKDSTTVSSDSDAATTDSSSTTQEALDGNYTIKDDKLTLTLGDYQVVLALSPDMKSFVVESDTGFEPKFNFEQIAEGDFSSIEADWINIANVPSPSFDTISDNWEPGDSSDEATLKITEQSITTNYLTVNASGFNTMPAAYQTRKLKDGLEITPTNGDFTRTGDGWTMNLYNRGTYESFIPRNGVTFEYSRDLIAINRRLADHTVKWSFYIRKRDALPTENKTTSAEAPKSTVINLEEITQNNFSSLMGEWKNPETGKSFTVTDEVKTVIFLDREETGVILTGEDMIMNGFPAVIEAGTTREDGSMQASFGYWDTTTIGATFQPIALLPIGVKVQSEPDDSDATQDRISFSMQGAIDDVYYRVK